MRQRLITDNQQTTTHWNAAMIQPDENILDYVDDYVHGVLSVG